MVSVPARMCPFRSKNGDGWGAGPVDNRHKVTLRYAVILPCLIRMITVSSDYFILKGRIRHADNFLKFSAETLVNMHFLNLFISISKSTIYILLDVT